MGDHHGELLAIAVASTAGAPMLSLESVAVISPLGLAGDRYAAEPRRAVTLIEAETLDAVVRDYGVDVVHLETRRNLLTRGVPLNHLVGRLFRVGAVTLRGTELCEPCGYLERMSGKSMKQILAHRGGLRAEVITGGEIRRGDPVDWTAPEER